MGFITDIFKPKVAAPATPPPKTDGTAVTDAQVNEAARRDRQRIQAMRGRQSTLGVGSVGGMNQPSTARTQLLGG